MMNWDFFSSCTEWYARAIVVLPNQRLRIFSSSGGGGAAEAPLYHPSLATRKQEPDPAIRKFVSEYLHFFFFFAAGRPAPALALRCGEEIRKRRRERW
jgi:hypothetical protein